MDDMMGFDIDIELGKIIERYRLDRHYPAYRTSMQACGYIRKWVERLSGLDTKILFITMDDSVLRMIYGWASGDNIFVIQISAIKELDNHLVQLKNADKIYVVAYTRTVEILHWLWRHDLDAESLYDVLEDSHIYCQMEFYRFFPPFVLSEELKLNGGNAELNVDGTAATLYEYYYQKQRLQHCGSGEDKRRLNEKLFFLAICMKNFIEAERILAEVSSREEYMMCWQEIKALLDRIKEILEGKRQKHIIVYWLDALSCEDAENLEYLQEQRKHSFYFHNAFTVTPYTYPTFKTMFYGICQIDDLGYQIKYSDLHKSPLLQDITDHGYDYKIMSNYINKRLDPQYICDYYGRQILNVPCSEAFWGLTRQIVLDCRPTFYLVHALAELHSPRLSVRRDNYEQKYLTRAETMYTQFEELNEQLRFYDQMMGDDPYRIYMSDHGPEGVAINKLHICFQIYNAAWENKEVNKLFCLLDFPKIIHKLLVREKIDDTTWEREYIPIQDVDFYNSVWLRSTLSIDSLEYLLLRTAYKGVVTSEYIYMYYKTGDELFHKWSDGRYVPDLAFVNSRKDSALLNDLRKKAGEFPKELDTDLQFEHSQNTYIILGNIRRTVLKVAKLLDEKLAGYAGGSIALRSGGYHTLQLCSVLSQESRKKIGGIIDRDSNCMGKKLGYQIYAPDDKLPDNIKAVLLSTYKNLGEFKDEANKTYNDLEIIDIYQYWRDYGYTFTKDFCFGLDTDRDIEFLKV